jgi:hypothetical protein
MILSFQFVAHVAQKYLTYRDIRLTKQLSVGAPMSYGHISSFLNVATALQSEHDKQIRMTVCALRAQKKFTFKVK